MNPSGIMPNAAKMPSLRKLASAALRQKSKKRIPPKAGPGFPFWNARATHFVFDRKRPGLLSKDI